MLLPRISLLGQIIQLSVCLLLIPKLGGGSTYHLFCRLVFSRNTTIKIALAVIKMAQRQIWRRAKTRGNEGGRGGIARATFCYPMEKVKAGEAATLLSERHCAQHTEVEEVLRFVT